MSSAYGQICRSYVRRTFRSWPVCIVVLANLPSLIVVMLVPKAIQHQGLMCLVMPLGFIGHLMWLHFREQIVDQRRFLLPGFLAPHLMAFATYALLLAAVVPGVMIWRGGFGSIGVLAFCMAFFALLGWCVATMSFFLLVITVIAWMALVWGYAADKIAALIHGGFEPQAYVILVASVVAAVAAVARLCWLTEETPAYRRRLNIDTRNLRPRMTGELTPVYADKRYFGFRLILGNPTIPPGAGLWRTAWAFSSLGRGGTLMNPIMLLLFVGIIRWTPTLGGLSISPALLIALFVALSAIFCMFFLPSWMSLWRYLEAVFLFPVERERFLKQIALAIAINFAESWILLAASFLGLFWWLIPGPFDWKTVVAALAVSASLQITCYGACVWLMRFRSAGRLFAGGAAMGVSMAFTAIMLTKLMGAGGDFTNLIWIVPFAVPVLIGVGCIIIYDAWGSWLVAELG